jgi:hypothetical protein
MLFILRYLVEEKCGKNEVPCHNPDPLQNLIPVKFLNIARKTLLSYHNACVGDG